MAGRQPLLWLGAVVVHGSAVPVRQSERAGSATCAPLQTEVFAKGCF